MWLSPRNLIAALRNNLHQLEMAVPPDTDQLKRNLNQRITELEDEWLHFPSPCRLRNLKALWTASRLI